MIISIAMVGFGCFLAGLVIASGRGMKAEDRSKELETELAKLSDHILWMTGDRSLGGEIDIRQVPGYLLEPPPPPRDGIDRLLDALEKCEVTRVSFLKSCNVGVLHFGRVSMRDTVEGNKGLWRPDLMLGKALLPKLTDAQAERARAMFRERMAQQAIGSLWMIARGTVAR